MLKNRLLFLSAVLTITAMLPVSAETLSEIEFPKSPAYRVGISSVPEKQFIEALYKNVKPEVQAVLDRNQDANVADMTYADLSIKHLSREISQELEYEEQEMVSDLSLLWQGAAIQSDTINFALYKLANPDADKPDKNSLKKVLTTIASMSTLVGASMSSPILAGSSLIGGNILGIMSQDTKALNYKYTKVGDADMIILIRKVEDLQQKAVNLYYDYMSAKKQLELANNLVNERAEKFRLAQVNNAPREMVVITDAYYRTALDKQRNAKSDFFSKRAALEQFVGNETFVQFEQELAARENGEKIVRQTNSEDEQSQIEYENTIQQVEQYTNSDKNSQTVEEVMIESENDTENKGYMATLPDLRPDTANNIKTDSEETITGSSSSVENPKKHKEKKVKKSKKDKEIELSEEAPKQDKKLEKKQQKEQKTNEKYSTKGLIFKHDNQTGVSKPVTTQPDQSVPAQQNVVPATNIYQQQIDGYNFMPLDAIKVPELTPGGYSIHGAY